MRYKRPIRAKYSILQYLGLLILYKVYAFRGYAYYIQCYRPRDTSGINSKTVKARP
jgi:hypothetical protein